MTEATYWANNGKYTKEYQALYEQHVPMMGASETLAGEVLRASSKIYYDAFNNGFCNNTSGAWNFLDQHMPQSSALREALAELQPCVNQSMNDVWMGNPEHPIAKALETMCDECIRFAMSDYAQEDANPVDMLDLSDEDDNSHWDEEDDDYWGEDEYEYDEDA